jgi:branched-chain amino acid transport system permease protein
LPIGIVLAFAVLPAAALLAGGEHLLTLGSRVMIFAIAAVALDLLVGYGALISLGHAAHRAWRHAVGILRRAWEGDALVSLPVAPAVAALTLPDRHRLPAHQGRLLIMITLAFGQMALFTASCRPIRGDDGLTIAARSTFRLPAAQE